MSENCLQINIVFDMVQFDSLFELGAFFPLSAPSGPKPSLPDLPLPAVDDDVSMSPTENQARKDQGERRKNKKKVVNFGETSANRRCYSVDWW